MSLWLAGLPLWIAAIFLVLLPTAAAMCGPVLIRRRIGLERLVSNNEIAGFKFATVGVIFAVLLAFAVIVVWEKFSDAETAVIQEAGAAATLYELASGPEPEAAATRVALGNYLELAIERDWPMMETGEESRAATQALGTLYATIMQHTDKGTKHPAIFAEMLTQLDTITRARRTRLHLATGVVPGNLMAHSLRRRDIDRGVHVLFRNQEFAGPSPDDRYIVAPCVHGPARDCLDRSPVYRLGTCWERAASKRRRGFQTELNLIWPA